MRSVLLSGGGLDSIAAIEIACNSAVPMPKLFDTVVCINYGQISANQEAKATQKYIEKYDLPLDFRYIDVQHISIPRWANRDSLLFGTGKEPMIVGRNLWLAFITASYFYVSGEELQINFALCREEIMFPDASKEAVDRISHVLYDAFKGEVTARAPFGLVPKLEFMKRAYRTNPDFMNESFTCWTPVNGQECGTCYHCKKKARLIKEIEG